MTLRVKAEWWTTNRNDLVGESLVVIKIHGKIFGMPFYEQHNRTRISLVTMSLSALTAQC